MVFGDIRSENTGVTPRAEFVCKKYGSIFQLLYNEDGSYKDVVQLIESLRFIISEKSEPLHTGDFDGDIRLGQPKRYSATDILQPLVILNAPPIHFDMLNHQSYDVSKCYNENQPQFAASYLKEQSQLTELETEINRDWALSASVSASASFWGVSVSSYFSQTWGEKFSKVDNTTTKVTVGIDVDAIEDDRIYAVVMDYDVWEYPIYVNGDVKAHALVVEPNAIENRWFPSKSWSGSSYIPEHEVGNILSYREYPLFSGNPLLDEKIKGDYNNSFVLDANSSYDWTLMFDDFTSSEATTKKEYSRDWGASVSGWGVGFSIDGSYSKEDINTQRTEVATGLKLNAHLDGLDMGIGEVGYIVTPYAYWAKNGSLVLDYAVKPELSDIGGTPTWWQVYYESHPDPAFILPWRYDPEKGYALQDEAKRNQTKDIQFSPRAVEAGDTVTITARVHNFSLIPTSGLIGVRFYAGDPDTDGVLLENIYGQSEVYTRDIIPARGSDQVEFKWPVSGNVGAYPRIYAVIDADNQLTEIHENNNKSWGILNKSSATGIENKEGTKNAQASNILYQNYPNPVRHQTTIPYHLNEAEWVNLSIFDISGKKVATLVSQFQPKGKYWIKWNSNNFLSGIYFYRLETSKGIVQTRKLIVVK